MDRRYGRVRPALAAIPVAVLLAAGCTGAAPQPTPKPVPTTAPGTVARAELGERLTLTASVERIITGAAFVVRDLDLTDGTLLVLSVAASAPAPPQLVTLEGIVIRFSHRELSERYHLGPPGPYQDFEGRRALVARNLTVWE
ncbi:hypothetical protein [Micromonospora sp. U21]|uniref:hypothetical protein n=1 Tax=Micromonospora sp. U21 TaxID=2824899 RepID=UPI001B35951B|nr:hypothetical protein [Micromonospora sp. U21]MBQ0906080.1 hypothetical protein [Micromonospora sp. U21]